MTMPLPPSPPSPGECLVEIHDEADARRILDLAPPVVGINNRDLAHFRTDTSQAARLANRLPRGSAPVAASGIHSADDIRQALASGLRRFLIGEALVKAPNPAELLRQWTSLKVSEVGGRNPE